MYNSNQFVPTPIRAHSVTERTKLAIRDIVGALYGTDQFKVSILGYYYSSVLFYSVVAFSKKPLTIPVDYRFHWEEIAEGFSLYLEDRPKVEIILGEASYQAPSHIKFLIIAKT